MTDGQLLERFASFDREPAGQAFSALVERHGAMVMRICRGVLPSPHDTEDAFQATFLVLARRARGLWVRDSLGPWLHQVALRTAKCARATAARQRRLERVVAISADESKVHPDDELVALLHEEIERLPETFRVPVILCDLEGRSHEQAARRLGWPVGTIKSRLSRARERLRARLTRRGLATEAGMVATPWKLSMFEERITTGLVESTTRQAVRFAASRLAIESSAATLALGVLNTMSFLRWIKIGSILLAIGSAATGAGLLARNGALAAGREPQAVKTNTASDSPVAEAKLGKLAKTIQQLGTLETDLTQNLLSHVEGTRTIVSIVPEGTRVKKGDIVCELDSASLRDKRTNQNIATQGAEAAYQK